MRIPVVLEAAAECVTVVCTLAAPVTRSEGADRSSACLTLTFDDAPATVYDNAGPLFAKHGFPATQFVITGAVSCPDEQSWCMNGNQIHELYQQGWEIGSHYYTHPYLTQMSDAALATEVDASFIALTEQRLHPEVFASPYGNYDARFIKAVAKRFPIHRRARGVT